MVLSCKFRLRSDTIPDPVGRSLFLFYTNLHHRFALRCYDKASHTCCITTAVIERREDGEVAGNAVVNRNYSICGSFSQRGERGNLSWIDPGMGLSVPSFVVVRLFTYVPSS